MIEQYTKLIGNSFLVVSLMRGFKAFISAIYLFEGRLAQSHLSRKLHDIICARKSILVTYANIIHLFIHIYMKRQEINVKEHSLYWSTVALV